ncbi:MAG: hypothetical protein OXH36_01400 [Bdellovibrionales bacterium]|nr:hypothetical protein [Bdellovibrionales bacterium]
MFILKVVFYICLLGIMIISAFADLEGQSIFQQLSSNSSVERIMALQNLQQTNDEDIHRKVIELALWDTDLRIRVLAEEVLNNMFPAELVSSDKKLNKHRDQVQRLRAKLLSVIPSEQKRALQSLKDLKTAPPIIQYTVIREMVLRPVDKEYQVELVRMAAFDSYFQKWLAYISAVDIFSDEIRVAVKNILMQVQMDFESQQELLNTATSREASYTTRAEAKKTLMKIKLDLRIQESLYYIVTSDTASTLAQVTAGMILTENKYIDLGIEQGLVSKAISEKADDSVRDRAKDILYTRHLHPAVQQRLRDMVRKAHEIPDQSRKVVEFILTWNKYINDNIELSLAGIVISNKVSDLARNLARRILYRRYISFNTQERLLNVAASSEVLNNIRKKMQKVLVKMRLDLEIQQKLLDIVQSPTSDKLERKAARYILIHSKLIHPEIKDNMSFSLFCRRAFGV